MTPRRTILCPVDFSDASRGALRYARAIASHFGARLLVLTVEDPLLTEAIALGTGVVWSPEETRKELARFTSKVLPGHALKDLDVDYAVGVGKPAREILRIAHEEVCELIVMSTNGLTGMRKLFFGSTTERVLRETTIPVLATPPSEEGPADLEDARRIVGRILVPVDLTPASIRQVRIARDLAEALQVPFIATYVVEPVRTPLAATLHLPGIEVERRARAEDALNTLLAPMSAGLHAEALVAYGDPAEEISKIARDRSARLIVVGLHSSPGLGPHMGSVTYRILCLTPVLVLALPPSEQGALPPS